MVHRGVVVRGKVKVRPYQKLDERIYWQIMWWFRWKQNTSVVEISSILIFNTFVFPNKRKENSSCCFCICVLDRFRMKQLAYKSSIPIMPKGLFETGACLIVTRSLLNYWICLLANWKHKGSIWPRPWFLLRRGRCKPNSLPIMFC